ncbi:MAG: hypothetical protein JAY94_09245 [Candidatus Thiodiazotropha endolucinida]|nr:hypothetical protein [Candidatus Thiodiazotropha taylori]MCW4317690.1 hypothetical protein [Candidatus Thiodiazotropha taylori]
MSIHQDQIQTPAMYYEPVMLNVDHNDREMPSTADAEGDEHEYEWADVLKEVEPYY